MTSSRLSQQMGDLHSLLAAMLSVCCGELGDTESEGLVSHISTAAVGVTRCGHTLPQAERGRKKEMPRSFKKDNLPATQTPLPTPGTRQGDVSRGAGTDLPHHVYSCDYQQESIHCIQSLPSQLQAFELTEH